MEMKLVRRSVDQRLHPKHTVLLSPFVKGMQQANQWLLGVLLARESDWVWMVQMKQRTGWTIFAVLVSLNG